MKRAIIAALLLATPAAAQQPQPAVQALDALLHQAVEREANATAQALALQAQVEALKKELEAAKPKPDPK